MYGYVEGASKPLAFPVVGFAAFWVPHCSFMAKFFQSVENKPLFVIAFKKYVLLLR